MKLAKFDARKIRPFKVIRIINQNVSKLELPQPMNQTNRRLLSPYCPASEKFLSLHITKSYKLFSDEPSNRLQIVEKLPKKSVR